MATVETITPVKAIGLAVVLAVVNPKNLILAVGACAGLGQLGLSTGDAVVAIIVFVAVSSLSILFAVGYELLGGERAHQTLDHMKDVDDPAQPRGDGGAVPRVRRGPDREGDRTPELQRLDLAGLDLVGLDLAGVVAGAAVGGDLAAGDPLTLVGGQPERGVPDVLRVADAQELLGGVGTAVGRVRDHPADDDRVAAHALRAVVGRDDAG